MKRLAKNSIVYPHETCKQYLISLKLHQTVWAVVVFGNSFCKVKLRKIYRSAIEEKSTEVQEFFIADGHIYNRCTPVAERKTIEISLSLTITQCNMIAKAP